MKPFLFIECLFIFLIFEILTNMRLRLQSKLKTCYIKFGKLTIFDADDVENRGGDGHGAGFFFNFITKGDDGGFKY